MSRNSRAWGILSLVLVLFTSAGLETAHALEDIGYVKIVRLDAFGAPPGQAFHPLHKLDSVVSNEVVETIEDGGLHLVFRDNTTLRLGSASRATLDRFVYDPDTAAGELGLSLGQGIFRLITGKLEKEGIRVDTPVATIGVRGTDFIVQVLASGAIILAVLEGMIEVLVSGAEPAVVGAGSTAAVGIDGQITEGVAAPPSDQGLGESGRSAGGTGEGDSPGRAGGMGGGPAD